MSNPADLGPVPERITVDAEQVRRLVEEQFSRWAGLPVQPVADGGWDNWTFHLGPHMLVRLPSAAEYALAVDKEHQWLPVLAPWLPLPIPVPLAKGRPGAGYPYPWSVYQWIDGQPATSDRIADPVRFAVDLAGFLAALQSVETAGGPRPGQHNWFRGGTLRTYDGEVRRALTALEGHADVDLAGEIWQAALDARWDGTENWFHGDVAEGNLLLSDGQLAAVIDFGTCGVGDMACDLAIAWTLLTADGQTAFRERLSVSDAAWARGRGWALWKSLAACASSLGETDAEAARAQHVLGEISPNTQAATGDRADSHGPDRRRVLPAAGRRSPRPVGSSLPYPPRSQATAPTRLWTRRRGRAIVLASARGRWSAVIEWRFPPATWPGPGSDRRGGPASGT